MKVSRQSIKNWLRYWWKCAVLLKTWGCYPSFQLSRKTNPTSWRFQGNPLRIDWDIDENVQFPPPWFPPFSSLVSTLFPLPLPDLLQKIRLDMLPFCSFLVVSCCFLSPCLVLCLRLDWKYHLIAAGESIINWCLPTTLKLTVENSSLICRVNPVV